MGGPYSATRERLVELLKEVEPAVYTQHQLFRLERKGNKEQGGPFGVHSRENENVTKACGQA